MNDDPTEAVALAGDLLRRAGAAAFGTLTGDGSPFVSLISVASDGDGSPLILVSELALHSANLRRDRRASLLVLQEAPAGEDRLAAARLSLVGAASDAANQEAARRRFLARHPEARSYASFADFRLLRFEIASAHLVAGFGRIRDIAPAALLAAAAEPA